VFSKFPRPLAAPAVIAVFTAAGFAQSDVSSWKGELHSDSLRLFAGYTVELLDQRHVRTERADVQLDGRFEFSRVPEGQYEMEIADGAGNLVYEDQVRVAETANTLEVRLPASTVERPPSGSVSARQLLHPPAPKAIAHARAAQKFSESGAYAKAAAELEAAVRISPEFSDARTNLGAQYLRLGRYTEAFEQLHQAVEIQPSATALGNLAYAQLLLDRPSDAAASARAALRYEPNSPAAHYILGMALAVSGSTAEAVPHLEKAAETLPSARVNLERLRAQ
jgi:tetratricopeptide (TPR) repeat protein